MLRFGTFLFVAVALSSALPSPGVNVFEPILTPEEAQKYLNSPPFTEPQLSSRTAVLPLIKYNDARFRSAEAGPTLGHYWKNGQEIENTDDYLEEVYDASQYHGQDGLGAYVYGYKTPQSAKQESRVRSGDVTGSYVFKAGTSNELIKVRYWADSEGFHQEDNLPKVVLQPVEEAEDVKQARLAHEKAWKEAAAAASLQPGPQGQYYPTNDYYYKPAASNHHSVAVPAPANFGDGEYLKASASNQQSLAVPAPANFGDGEYLQGSASAQQDVAVPPPEQAREGKAYYGAQAQAQFSRDNYNPTTTTTTTTTEEPTGPPHGFFYSFDYPVSVIVSKKELEGPAIPAEYDSVYAKSNRA